MEIKWKYDRVFKTPIKVTFALSTGVAAAISDACIQVQAVSTGVSNTMSYESRIRFTDA